MRDRKTYTFGERRFYQAPLRLGQVEHLLRVVTGVSFTAEDPVGIIRALADRLPQALACVLVPEDQTQEEHVRRLDGPDSLAAAVEFLRGALSVEQAVEVAADFLDCTPISSISDRVTGLLTRLGPSRTPSVRTPSKPSMPSSPEATSASATVSGAA